MRILQTTAVLTAAATALLALGGCSGSDDPDLPPLTGSSAPASGAALTSPTSSVVPDLPDPCDLVSTDQISELVGAEVTAYPSDFSAAGQASAICGYSSTKKGTASVKLQLSAGTDNSDLGPLAAQYPGTRADVTVDGTDQAVQISHDDPTIASSTIVASLGEDVLTVTALAPEVTDADQLAQRAAALLATAVGS